MRTRHVKVRRDRPSVLAWSLAMVVTMLVVYLLTLGSAPPEAPRRGEEPAAGERVTRELSFEPLALYCVQFGSFDSAEEARIEAARYVERGAAGYVCAAAEKHLVLGAGYALEADAARVAERLAQEEGIPGAVFARESARVRMRVTAGENQIAALAAADAALRTQVDQLGELAFQIDRGELRGDAARTLIAIQAAQVRDVLGTLKAIPGENPIFSALTGQVEALAAALDVLSHAGGETDLALSGQIKYDYIQVRLGYIDFLRGLG